MSGKLVGRFCLCAAVVVPLAFAAGSVSAASPRDPRAHAAVACSEPFNYPKLQYPVLYGVAAFRCSTGASRATATLILQGFENGKWTKLASASLTVRARPGKK